MDRAAARRRPALLQRGVERGEVRDDVDPEIALDLLYGPLYLRLLVGHGASDERFLSRLVETAFDGIGAAHPARRR